MDPAQGQQPIHGRDGAAVVHNGEIYNFRALARELAAAGRHCVSGSDSEVLAQLYEEHGRGLRRALDGVFAFAAVHGDDWLVARDAIGVKPLYYGRDRAGNLWFASELKALIDDACRSGVPARPSHDTQRRPASVVLTRVAARRVGRVGRSSSASRRRLSDAVDKRLMSDVPLGLLLSGGLDSSLIAALATRRVRARDPDAEIHSFAIGVDKDAPDLRAAREVARYLGTTHHEVLFRAEEGIAALDDIVRHVESYDIPTIRASIPMYFLSRYIHERGVKVVLSGEGSDEIFGGYLYFYYAPNAREFATRLVARVTGFITARPARGQATMAHGVEARVPFLDHAFFDLAMSIAARQKQPRRLSRYGRAGSRSRSCATRCRRAARSSPRRCSGVRRSSSRTASVMAGSTRCADTPRSASRCTSWLARRGASRI